MRTYFTIKQTVVTTEPFPCTQIIKKSRKRSPSKRTCKICDLKLCKDERHFILICYKYDEIRHCILDFMLNNVRHIYISTLLIFLMQNRQKDLITYPAVCSLERRRRPASHRCALYSRITRLFL